MNPHNTNTTRYGILETLANHDGPATCKEIWEALEDDDRRPATAPDEEAPWGNVTSTTADLFSKHLVDRQKRDVKYKPYEYWLAAKGRDVLRQNGDLPDEADVRLAQPTENDRATYLGEAGLDTDGEDLPAVLRGLSDAVLDLRGRVDAMGDDVVTHDDLQSHAEADQRVQSDVEERLADLTAAVAALDHSVGREQTAADGPLTRLLEDLRRRQREGYDVYQYKHEEMYGGNVVNMEIQLKPASEVASKGPGEDDVPAADLEAAKAEVSRAVDAALADQDASPAECYECGARLGDEWATADALAQLNETNPAPCTECGENPLPPVGSGEEAE